MAEDTNDRREISDAEFFGGRPDEDISDAEFFGGVPSTDTQDAVSSLYLPSARAGLLESASIILDLPILALGHGMAAGADVLGYDETAGLLRNPILVSDATKALFEAPARIEEAITGEDATFTRGFNATPRKATNAGERFWRDVFYAGGSAVSFPMGLGAIFGTYKAPVQKLLQDASGRSSNSGRARTILGSAQETKGPSAAQALVNAGRQYAAEFAVNPVGRSVAREHIVAVSSGVGFGLPEALADDDGRIMVDLGGGEVDVAPTLKVLSSIGLPILVSGTPGALALSGGESVNELVKLILNKGSILRKSLMDGMSESGRADMAARVVGTLVDDKDIATFLRGIQDGTVRGIEEAPVVLATQGGAPDTLRYGGIQPDTVQVLNQINPYGIARIAALDSSLAPAHLDGRFAEAARRASTLEESFEKLEASVAKVGDAATLDPEVVTKFVTQARQNLIDDTTETVDRLREEVASAYRNLEPAVSGAAASEMIADMVIHARRRSETIRNELYSKKFIGTEFVDTSDFGPWAIRYIREVGDRNISVTPGMDMFYKLAGLRRLKEENLLPSGKPITNSDLAKVKSPEGQSLVVDDMEPNGLYDVFGPGNTIYGEPVKITTLDKFRSEASGRAHEAMIAGKNAVYHRYNDIVKYIDDVLLAPENFRGKVTPENLTNIKVAREFAADAAAQYGINTDIGKLLFRGPKRKTEFLEKFIKSGTGSGERIDELTRAINVPVRRGTTWERPGSLPAADQRGPFAGGVALEAELLRRFTESIPKGQVTQRRVDFFITRYGNAIDKVSGLRARLNNLKETQRVVDAVTDRITGGAPDEVARALKQGATAEDLNTGKVINSDALVNRQFMNTTAEILDADPSKVARAYLSQDRKNAGSRAKSILALLETDPTGDAGRGFRLELLRVLKQDSMHVRSNSGEPIPGIDARKFQDSIDANREYLEEFFDPYSMRYLDQIFTGGSLFQKVGIPGPARGSTVDALGNFGTQEVVGAVGRSLGQKAFGAIGINPLVATGMGRRIAAYTFSRVGQEQIFKLVEDALRDPSKAAILLRRYQKLDKWAPSSLTREAVDDTLGTAQDQLTYAGGFLRKFLKGRTKEAVERAVRFGLIPVQGELSREREETPSASRDSRSRYEVEEADQVEAQYREGVKYATGQGVSKDFTVAARWFSLAAEKGDAEAQHALGVLYANGQGVPRDDMTAMKWLSLAARQGHSGAKASLNMLYEAGRGTPPARRTPSPRANNRPPSGASVLGQVRMPPPPTRGPSPETAADMDRLGLPLFPVYASHGGYVTRDAESGGGRIQESGIMSVKCGPKPRQLVG